MYVSPWNVAWDSVIRSSLLTSLPWSEFLMVSTFQLACSSHHQSPKKQDSSFQNWEVSQLTKNLLCGRREVSRILKKNLLYWIVEYKAGQFNSIHCWDDSIFETSSQIYPASLLCYRKPKKYIDTSSCNASSNPMNMLWFFVQVYTMKSKPRGIAAIINNKHFRTMNTRKGTNIDGRNLKHVFTKLGFNVIEREDQTGEVSVCLEV